MSAALSKQDLAQCKAGMYECQQLIQEIDRAKACGLDCDERELRATHLLQFFRSVLDQYSPGSLPPAGSAT